MHWLGIDVGRKRIGLAISDPQTKIATALGTIEFKTNDFAGAAVLVKKKLTHAGYCPVVCGLLYYAPCRVRQRLMTDWNH